MPEDTSDDSSISDCCSLKQAAIRKPFLMHTQYWRKGSVVNRTLRLADVCVSRFVNLLLDNTVTYTDIIMGRPFIKRTGLRDKIFLFFKKMYELSVRHPARGCCEAAHRLQQSKYVLPVRQRIRLSGSARENTAGSVRNFASVFETASMFLRVSGLMLSHHHIAQLKY